LVGFSSIIIQRIEGKVILTYSYKRKKIIVSWMLVPIYKMIRVFFLTKACAMCVL